MRATLVRKPRATEHLGDLRMFIRISAILGLCNGISTREIATMLQVSQESIRLWVRAFLLRGVEGLTPKKSPGRPSKLTKSQRRELAEIIDQGPAAAGFVGNCWRSPMIQQIIYEKFKVAYSVHYLSELLRNMGFSYQKARFVSDHLDEEARQTWLARVWPQILATAQRKTAYLLFGDEASFPQWGTLSYTWARKGKQPTVKTSGKRKGYKVFGLIDYFTGRFFYQCQESRLNSASYVQFLKEVLKKTRKHIILIQDGAKYHTSAATREFFAQNQDRLTVFSLPSYSPDYNPIEKLWKKVKKEGTHLHYFKTFNDLVNKVNEALLVFKNSAKEILTLFGIYNKLSEAA